MVLKIPQLRLRNQYLENDEQPANEGKSQKFKHIQRSFYFFEYKHVTIITSRLISGSNQNPTENVIRVQIYS